MVLQYLDIRVAHGGGAYKDKQGLIMCLIIIDIYILLVVLFICCYLIVCVVSCRLFTPLE